MTAPEPCGDCGQTVRLMRSLVQPGTFTPWGEIGQVPLRFHSDGSPASRQPMFAPHTPQRCRSARQQRETTR